MSGLHFGHYKAAVDSDYMSEMHSLMSTIATATGYSFDRWQNGLTVLLEKKEGLRIIQKLRAILLMEADFNMVNKIMIGDRMIKQAEKHGELPADTIGGRKDMASHEGGLNRVLMSDVSRQRRQDLLMLSEDADTCYDRMQHTGISLSTRRLGVPTPTNTTMLVTLQQMRFFLRTGFGTSSTYFGRQQLTPFQGGCQGNGAAPGFWLAISIVLI